MALLRALRRRPDRQEDPAGAAPAPEVVSVVVPVYQAESYLDECLESVRAQTYAHLQIVVVDDGSRDASAAICARHAELDPRVEVHRQDNAGLGAARNAGIARSTGTYLTFLDADDTLPLDAYEHLAGSLSASGSDFAIGAVQRVTGSTRRTPRWSADVHDRDRRGVTIEGFPDALLDVIACNRMFRRDFWASARLRFPEGVAYEDHLPMVTAYVRATGFDLLEATTYHWRIREDGSSLGQQKHRVENLRDRLTAKQAAWEMLQAEASLPVQRAWRARVLDMDLPLFIDRLPGAGAEWADTLAGGVREHLGAADAQVLEQVRVERRVKEQLLAAGRRGEVEAILAEEVLGGPVPTTRVVDGEVVADYPAVPGLAAVCPDLRLTSRQTRLRTTLRRCWWSSPGVLEVDLSAFVPYVDLADPGARATLRTRAWWVDGAGAQVPAAVVPYEDPEITRAEQPAAQCYDAAGLRTTLDVGRLRDGAGPPRSWHLEVEVAVAGVVRRDVVRYRDGRGSAGALRAGVLADGSRATLDQRRARGLELTLHPAVASFATAAAVGGDLALSARVHGSPVRRLVAAARGRPGQVGADADVDGVLARVRLPLDRLAACSPEGRWTLRAVLEGTKVPLGWPATAADDDLLPVTGSSTLRVWRSETGTAVLEDRSEVAVVTDGLVSETTLELSLRWAGGSGAPSRVRLVQDADALELAQGPDGRWRLPGGPAGLVSDGEWHLQVTGEGGSDVRLLVATTLLAQLPALVAPADAAWRAVLVRTRGTGLGLLREPRDWTPAEQDD